MVIGQNGVDGRPAATPVETVACHEQDHVIIRNPQTVGNSAMVAVQKHTVVIFNIVQVSFMFT